MDRLNGTKFQEIAGTHGSAKKDLSFLKPISVVFPLFLIYPTKKGNILLSPELSFPDHTCFPWLDCGKGRDLKQLTAMIFHTYMDYKPRSSAAYLTIRPKATKESPFNSCMHIRRECRK